MQCASRDFRGIDNPCGHKVLKSFSGSVIAEVWIFTGPNLLDYHRAFFAGVLNDLAQRLFKRAPDDVDAHLLIALYVTSLFFVVVVLGGLGSLPGAVAVQTVRDALAAHPDVARVCFTGSVATGRKVAAAAGGARACRRSHTAR